MDSARWYRWRSAPARLRGAKLKIFIFVVLDTVIA
jgi:hypothetical protein